MKPGRRVANESMRSDGWEGTGSDEYRRGQETEASLLSR